MAVDLDLGGSNLHTCLGLDNNNPGIGDYLRAHYGNLEELIVDTSHPNLKFLAGDARSPFMANLHSTQKNKLMNQPPLPSALLLPIQSLLLLPLQHLMVPTLNLPLTQSDLTIRILTGFPMKPRQC